MNNGLQLWKLHHRPLICIVNILNKGLQPIAPSENVGARSAVSFLVSICPKAKGYSPLFDSGDGVVLFFCGVSNFPSLRGCRWSKQTSRGKLPYALKCLRYFEVHNGAPLLNPVLWNGTLPRLHPRFPIEPQRDFVVSDE